MNTPIDEPAFVNALALLSATARGATPEAAHIVNSLTETWQLRALALRLAAMQQHPHDGAVWDKHLNAVAKHMVDSAFLESA